MFCSCTRCTYLSKFLSLKLWLPLILLGCSLLLCIVPIILHGFCQLYYVQFFLVRPQTVTSTTLMPHPWCPWSPLCSLPLLPLFFLAPLLLWPFQFSALSDSLKSSSSTHSHLPHYACILLSPFVESVSLHLLFHSSLHPLCVSVLSIPSFSYFLHLSLISTSLPSIDLSHYHMWYSTP